MAYIRTKERSDLQLTKQLIEKAIECEATWLKLKKISTGGVKTNFAIITTNKKRIKEKKETRLVNSETGHMFWLLSIAALNRRDLISFNSTNQIITFNRMYSTQELLEEIEKMCEKVDAALTLLKKDDF